MVSKPEANYKDSSGEGEKRNLLFNADIVNFLLESNKGIDRRLNFVFCSVKCFNSLVIRQKCTCVYQEERNVCFFEN